MTGPQFAAAIGITYRILHRWCTEGVFGPELIGSGSGTRRTFPTRLLEPGMAAADVTNAVCTLAANVTTGASINLVARVVQIVAERPVGPGDRIVIDAGGCIHRPRLGESDPTGLRLVIPLRRHQPAEAAR